MSTCFFDIFKFYFYLQSLFLYFINFLSFIYISKTCSDTAKKEKVLILFIDFEGCSLSEPFSIRINKDMNESIFENCFLTLLEFHVHQIASP